MPALIEYLIKLSICLSVVYIFYQLFLRRLTFYNWNRWYFLGYAALSYIIPLIDVMPQLRKREIADADIISWIPAWSNGAQSKNIFEMLEYWDWIMILLAIGVIFFLLRFLTRIYSFMLTKKKAILVTKQPVLLYQLNENITPFSFGGAIFVNKNLHEENELQEIIRHEFVHVKQKHTIDLLFAEMLCIVNWFNPFAWLIRQNIKQNLEFIADDKVVQNGLDKTEYQYLLLKVMGNKQFTFTNHFNFSSLKKRIAMMNTLKSARVHLIKFLFLLPVVAVLSLSFRKEIQKASIPLNAPIIKDTIPDQDSGYKISVITTPGNFNSEKMQRTVIEKMSLEDWNKNKEFYEKKYGQSVQAKAFTKMKNGKEVRYDSVYVTRYKPKPIDKDNPPLFVIDGKPQDAGNFEALNIKADEVESVTVLKDRAAKSIWGPKAENGVILIVTKKGFKYSSPNMIDSLQGKVSGIRINSTNISARSKAEELGTADGKINVTVSSTSDRISDKALKVLDGKEISDEELSEIDSKRIESIRILKDESATFAYGDKGKNGVVLIQLKKEPEAIKPDKPKDSQ